MTGLGEPKQQQKKRHDGSAAEATRHSASAICGALNRRGVPLEARRLHHLMTEKVGLCRAGKGRRKEGRDMDDMDRYIIAGRLAHLALYRRIESDRGRPTLY
jgi:hypothetical protein